MLWQDMEIVYEQDTNKGVSLASAGADLHIIEYDDVQIYDDPTTTYDFEIVHYHVVDDTPGYYEFVFAYDNINGPLDGATIGTENSDGTLATQYAYNNASFTDGHMVCFDLVTPSTTKTITFQVTVNADAPAGPLTNVAVHDTASEATVEEAADAIVQIGLEPTINEFSASTTGTDVEFVEFFGSPNLDYSAYTFLGIEGDGSTSNSYEGYVDNVIPLGTTDANGIYLADLASNTLENGTISFLLVTGNTAGVGDDLDTDDDGVLDSQPWSEIVDSVAVHDGGADDLTYTTPVLGVNYDGLSNFAPGGASRIPDGFDTNAATDWVRNDFDLAGIPGYTGSPVAGEAYNTPGELNQIVNVIAYADAYETVEETELIVAAAEGVLVFDVDLDGDTLTAELVTDVTHGTLIFAADGSFTYTPNVDFFGEDSFTYRATDGTNLSAATLVTITVTPVNDAPTAVDDAYTVQEDGLLEIAAPGILENDIEVDLDNMIASLVINVEHGSLALLGDGSFTYQPEPGFVGTDTFVYNLVTYPNMPASMWTDEATVTITVTPLPRIYLPLIFK